MPNKDEKNIKDSDADGLTDEEEIKLGTNPFEKDSDSDGLADYEEVKIYGTDPLNPDTDKDGMSDGEEVKRGRNPRGKGKLKDLFIPHEGNDYKPHALRPKRVAFYAASSVLIKVLVVGFILIFPIEAWLTPDILAKESKKIIELTNEIRNNLNLNLLAESKPLNQAAYAKAEDMLINQYFAHVGPDKKSLANWLDRVKYNFRVAGENLAMGFSTPEEVVNGWTRSKTHYANIIDESYKEIGVGMTSGAYKDYDTTFVAQYFGVTAYQPKIISGDISDIPKEDLPPTTSLVKRGSSEEELAVDLDKTKITVSDLVENNKKIIKVDAYLGSSITKAEVSFSNYQMELSKEEEEENKWTGKAIIYEEDQEQIFSPVVLPTLTTKDLVGNEATTDIKWENITPIKPSLVNYYLFLKSHQSKYLKPILNLSSIYYQVILLILAIALLLNIFIEIKKQHPRIIFSSLGLIGLLIVLIMV